MKNWKEILGKAARETGGWKMKYIHCNIPIEYYDVVFVNDEMGWNFPLSIAAKEGNELKSALNFIKKSAENFDVSRETYRLLEEDGHGTYGVPDNMVDLYHDMEYIKTSIKRLADRMWTIAFPYFDLEMQLQYVAERAGWTGSYEPDGQFFFSKMLPDVEDTAIQFNVDLKRFPTYNGVLQKILTFEENLKSLKEPERKSAKEAFEEIKHEAMDHFDMSEICGCDVCLRRCEESCERYSHCDNVAIAEDMIVAMEEEVYNFEEKTFNVNFKILLRPNETEEEARLRLSGLITSELCNLADHDISFDFS